MPLKAPFLVYNFDFFEAGPQPTLPPLHVSGLQGPNPSFWNPLFTPREGMILQRTLARSRIKFSALKCHYKLLKTLREMKEFKDDYSVTKEFYLRCDQYASFDLFLVPKKMDCNNYVWLHWLLFKKKLEWQIQSLYQRELSRTDLRGDFQKKKNFQANKLQNFYHGYFYT